MRPQALASVGESKVTSSATSRVLLRADALFLLIAGGGGFVTDLLGAFFGVGAQAPIIGAAPHAAIGFVEAHGLAFIIGLWLWNAQPQRAWHLTAAAVHVLLGASNLVFWQIFIAADALAAGYLTTSLHWFFVATQFAAALAARPVRD
jgi:hypothetical protein